jgi:hypothetical protein
MENENIAVSFFYSIRSLIMLIIHRCPACVKRPIQAYFLYYVQRKGQLPTIHLESSLVLFVFLPALIFEGAWSISLDRLRQNWLTIFFLVVPGLLLELGLIALPLYFFTRLGWRETLLLSAILSPTDPVAVLSLFKQLKADVDISNIIEGERLFNDGIDFFPLIRRLHFYLPWCWCSRLIFPRANTWFFPLMASSFSRCSCRVSACALS